MKKNLFLECLGFVCFITAGVLVISYLQLRAYAGDKKPLGSELPGNSLYHLTSDWTNDEGESLRLASMRGRPLVLALMFTNCEFACPMIVNDMRKIEKSLSKKQRKGVDFVLVTLDPERDTVGALRAYRDKMRLAGSGWTLLTGGAENIRELAAVLGFNYREDEREQYAHSNLITLIDANGVVVHQQQGMNNEPKPMTERILKILP